MAKFHSLFQKIIHDTLLFFDSMEGKEKEKQKRSVDVVGMAVIGRVSNVFESDDGKKKTVSVDHIWQRLSRGVSF